LILLKSLAQFRFHRGGPEGEGANWGFEEFPFGGGVVCGGGGFCGPSRAVCSR